MAFKDSYILSIDKFDKKYIEDREDLAAILFDEYTLDYTYVNNAKKLKVLVKSNEDLIKLKKMIKMYSNDKKYADEVIGNDTNESIKNIKYNKMRDFRNSRPTRRPLRRSVNESRISRLNRNVTARRIRMNESEDFNERLSRRIRPISESNQPMRFRRGGVLTESTRERIKRRIEERRMNENRRFLGRKSSFLKESEDAKKCPTSYEGKKIAKMTKAEKRSAASQVKKDIKEAQKMLKDREKKGLSTKAIEAKIEKLQALLDCLTKKEEVKESIRSRFSRSRRIFESEEDNADNEETEETEDVEDTNDAEDTEDTEDTDETEDVDVKAITLKVLNKNVDKLKDALIEAGVEEDDIEVTDNEDAEDDDEVGIKVDVNSFDALKSYCESIGIDLEEELGGEVVSDDEEEDNTADDTESVDTDDESDDEEDSDFTDAEMDDLFKDM